MPFSQLSIPGVAPPRPRTTSARCQRILEEHPDSRDDYRLVQFYYWLEYCDLATVVVPADFKAWYCSVVTAKTLLQRAQEVQRANPQLAPSPEVAAKRKRQSCQPAHRW